jgi:predicted secreted protein
MTAFLLKEHLHDDTYATIAGLKVETEQRATNSVRITAKGIFTRLSSARSIMLAATYGTELEFELSFEHGERLRARFAVESCEYAGTTLGEQQYRLTLKSVGPVKVLETL